MLSLPAHFLMPNTKLYKEVHRSTYSSQFSSRGERTVLSPRRDPPLMCRVPLSVMLTLAVPLSTGMSSLYQVSTGGGLPLARHVIDAIVCSGSVWLAGPSSMTGGGRSSDDVTVRRARELSEPATLTAEHTTTSPLSFFCTLYSTVQYTQVSSWNMNVTRLV